MTIMSAGLGTYYRGVRYIRACRLVYLPISVRLRLARNLDYVPMISRYILHASSLLYQAKYCIIEWIKNKSIVVISAFVIRIKYQLFISTDRKLYNFISYRNFTSIIVSNSKR